MRPVFRNQNERNTRMLRRYSLGTIIFQFLRSDPKCRRFKGPRNGWDGVGPRNRVTCYVNPSRDTENWLQPTGSDHIAQCAASMLLSCFRLLLRPAPDRRRRPCAPTPRPRRGRRLPAPRNRRRAPWSPSQQLRIPCRAQAPNEDPDTSSLHLVVERVDIAVHRFILARRVVVVGVVNSNHTVREYKACIL